MLKPPFCVCISRIFRDDTVHHSSTLQNTKHRKDVMMAHFSVKVPTTYVDVTRIFTTTWITPLEGFQWQLSPPQRLLMQRLQVLLLFSLVFLPLICFHLRTALQSLNNPKKSSKKTKQKVLTRKQIKQNQPVLRTPHRPQREVSRDKFLPVYQVSDHATCAFRSNGAAHHFNDVHAFSPSYPVVFA